MLVDDGKLGNYSVLKRGCHELEVLSQILLAGPTVTSHVSEPSMSAGLRPATHTSVDLSVGGAVKQHHRDKNLSKYLIESHTLSPGASPHLISL